MRQYDTPEGHLGRCEKEIRDGRKILKKAQKQLDRAEAGVDTPESTQIEIQETITEAKHHFTTARSAFRESKTSEDPAIRKLNALKSGSLIRNWAIPGILVIALFMANELAGFELKINQIAIVSVGIFALVWIVNHYRRSNLQATIRKRNRLEADAQRSLENFEKSLKSEVARTRQLGEKMRSGRQQRLFQSFGYQRADLARFLAEFGALRAKGTSPSEAVPVLVDFLLEQQRIGVETRRLFEKAEGQNIIRRYLFSFLFSTELASEVFELAQDRFQDIFAGAFRTRAAELAMADEANPDPQRTEDFIYMIEDVEVIFTRDLEQEFCCFTHKPRPSDDRQVDFIISTRSEPDCKLVDWQCSGPGRWYSINANAFFCDSDAEFFIGPPGGTLAEDLSTTETNIRIENHHSAIVDCLSDDATLAQRIDVSSFQGNQHDELLNKLGLQVLVQNIPFFVPTDIKIRELKGSIRVVGYWVDNEWHDLEDNPSSRLTKTGPNVLIKSGQTLLGSFGDGTLRRNENRLLSDFLFEFTQKEKLFDLAISAMGNFEIVHGPKADGSPVYQFFIKIANDGGTITRHYLPSIGRGWEAHKELENYENFQSASGEPSELERDGYHRLAFSSCYLLTGGDKVQLCLELDLGSPSLGEGIDGYRQFDENLLRRTLRRYAYGKGVDPNQYIELESETGQGFIATAPLTDEETGENLGNHYLKLLDPPHVKRFRTDQIISLLQTGEVLPSEISWERVTSNGRSGGNVLIITTPEYRCLGDELRIFETMGKDLPAPSRIALCRGLIRFIDTCLSQQHIVCQDLSIGDVMFTDNTLDELLARLESDQSATAKPLVFVGDHGSYCFTAEFDRANKISRGEFNAPEDYDETLPLKAEPFQVFILGIHLLQILAMKPGLSLDCIRRLGSNSTNESFARQDEYTQELDQELTQLFATLPHDVQPYQSTIRQMLDYQPDKRQHIAGLYSI